MHNLLVLHLWCKLRNGYHCVVECKNPAINFLIVFFNKHAKVITIFNSYTGSVDAHQKRSKRDLHPWQLSFILLGYSPNFFAQVKLPPSCPNMESYICRHCDSKDSEISSFRPKDFPGRFYFVQCANCHTKLGVVDIYDVIDCFHQNSARQRNLAIDLLTRLSNMASV